MKFRSPSGQGLTGTRYPTRPDNFWQYPIHNRFIFRIIGYFGYRVFHLFWPNVPVLNYTICQVWTCHQSSLQRIQFLKSYNRDVGTVIYKIMPIIRHCAPFCTHYFFFPRNMLFSRKFMNFCHNFLSLRFKHYFDIVWGWKFTSGNCFAFIVNAYMVNR